VSEPLRSPATTCDHPRPPAITRDHLRSPATTCAKQPVDFFFSRAFSFSLYSFARVKSYSMQPLEILLYTAPEGKTHIEVFYEEETFWLSQKKMAELFGVDVRTVNEHLQNIFKTSELEEI
jgi:hypothetical protein